MSRSRRKGRSPPSSAAEQGQDAVRVLGEPEILECRGASKVVVIDDIGLHRVDPSIEAELHVIVVRDAVLGLQRRTFRTSSAFLKGSSAFALCQTAKDPSVKDQWTCTTKWFHCLSKGLLGVDRRPSAFRAPMHRRRPRY